MSAARPDTVPHALAGRGQIRSRSFLEESLGIEPALDTGTPAVATARHAPSLRWLGASVLIGVTGAVLLGAAIYVAAKGQVTFAEVAERAGAPAPRALAEDGSAGLRKADKLVRAETVASAKQTFKAPMTLRSGDREVIRVRSFTRLATGLSLTTGVYATGIPSFNPMRFFASAEPERGAELPAETPDAEVSVAKSDLSAVVLEPTGPTLGDAEVAAQIGEGARAVTEAGRRSLPPLPSGLLLGSPLPATAGAPGSAAPPAAEAAFRSIEVRVVPENVTNLVKSEARPSSLVFEERVVPIRHGDTIEGLLAGNGAGPDDARLIVSALGTRDRAPTSLEGSQLRLLLAPPPSPTDGRPLVRAVLFGERGIEAIAAKNDRGAFVSVAPPPVEAPRGAVRDAAEDGEEDEGEGGVRLYESLYETALKHDLSRQTVEDLIRIFGYDVDFQRRVQPGDGFELFYASDEEGPGERLEILSAMLRLGSEVRRVYRYQGEDGTVDWFDEAGRSLKKFLLRKPIVEGRFTSGFGRRSHPILGYARAHNGVDWANKVGTPIFAAGNGTVIKADWDSGYGRRIEIQHANGYVTTYNHQSAFARGIGKGSRVRQGQVIGYVGSTGLSTGAHLHYEVIVNGHYVDPMRIRVPRGRELDGRALADFARQREQVDSIMQRGAATNRYAQRDIR